MATTTAQVIISSTNLLSSSLSINPNLPLQQSDGSSVESSTFLAATKHVGTSIYTWYVASAYGNNGAAKVYIKNNDTTFANFVTITIGSQTLGRLYGGDWALIPWDATNDFKATNNNSGTTIEHMLLHEGA